MKKRSLKERTQKWKFLFRRHKKADKRSAANQNRQLLFVAYILFAGVGFDDPPSK